MTDINSRIKAAKEQVSSLEGKISSTLASKRDKALTKAEAQPVRSNIKSRRTLKGHFGKVTALHWAGDSRYLVSAAQDGNLLVWNAVHQHKVQSISLKSSYVMSVGFEEGGGWVACGGLDNLCTIFNVQNPTKSIEMASHDGFLSCCRFLDPSHVLTSSGDSTCIHWDTQKATPISVFSEHKADAMSICIKKEAGANTFLSCSVDKTVKLWDVRSGKSAQTILGFHKGDINGVEFMSEHAFVTASQDNTMKVFDLRANNELASFNGPNIEEPDANTFTSVGSSKSGRVIFGGHANGNIVAVDVLTGKTNYYNHGRYVSCIGVAPSGDAVCSGSWDYVLKIWA